MAVTLYGKMKRVYYQFDDHGEHTFKNGKKDWYYEIFFKKIYDNLEELTTYHKVKIKVTEVTGLHYSYFDRDKNGNYEELPKSKSGLQIPKEIWDIVLKKLQTIHINKIPTCGGE